MYLRVIRQLVSFRDVRNIAVGLFVVLGGIALAFLTLYAHRNSNPTLAGIAAVTSLVFVLILLIFVVPPLARNASKEASQLNLPFEFTVSGAVFLGLMAIVAFSAWNSGNNLLFLVLSFLTAAMVVGFFAGGSSLKKLDVRMRFPETIFAGDPTKILVSLQNRKRLLPSYSVVAEVRGRERERSVAAKDLERLLPKRLAERFSKPPLVSRTLSYFIHIPHGATVENTATHIFPNRGRFLIKDFELSTRFPFGFFRHRRRLPARETELIVFPRIDAVEHSIDDLPLEVGKLEANRRGSGQDLQSLREYQSIDDLRRIDWKATARTSTLTVREFSAEDDTRIVVIFDTRVPDTERPRMTVREQIEAEQRHGGIVVSERFETGVRRAASLIAQFSDLQGEICLVIGSEVGDFGIGRRHLHSSLRRLAILEPHFTDFSAADDPFDSVDDRLELLENTHNFVITTASANALPDTIVQKCHLIGY
jgi:uncharacterized protein (DUF58 family)